MDPKYHLNKKSFRVRQMLSFWLQEFLSDWFKNFLCWYVDAFNRFCVGKQKYLPKTDKINISTEFDCGWWWDVVAWLCCTCYSFCMRFIMNSNETNFFAQWIEFNYRWPVKTTNHTCTVFVREGIIVEIRSKSDNGFVNRNRQQLVDIWIFHLNFS